MLLNVDHGGNRIDDEDGGDVTVNSGSQSFLGEFSIYNHRVLDEQDKERLSKRLDLRITRNYSLYAIDGSITKVEGMIRKIWSLLVSR